MSDRLLFDQLIRGPMLAPAPDGSVIYHADAGLAFADQTITFAGPWTSLPRDSKPTRQSAGIILPPLLDLHTHIPQHPIRGRFLEGIDGHEPHGKLLAGLARNVFPAEVQCNAEDYARTAIESFAADVLANGVVGGAAFMTVSARATELALEILPPTWSVGLVMMNQNCPTDLRSDEKNLARDIEKLAAKHGRRFIVTDRFAVSTNSPLRRVGSKLASNLGLRMQTHLNEQIAEKHFVEYELYPKAKSYTDVYLQDGLLDHQPILAHCIHMTPVEWEILAATNSAIAHCPTSNLLLGSGTMSLEHVKEHRIPYAIATDVGASPTVSMLAEMQRFLQVHNGRATPSEALWRATLAPAQILGLEKSLGRLEPGYPASFVEVDPVAPPATSSTDDAIRSILPKNIDHPDRTILRVTIAGKTIFEKPTSNA